VALPAGGRDDLGEPARALIVDRERVERSLHQRERQKALRPHDGVLGDQHADVELGKGHHRYRGFVGELSQRTILFAGHEHRCVEQAPHRSWIVVPRKESRSSAKSRSSGAPCTILAASEAGSFLNSRWGISRSSDDMLRV